MLTSLRSKAQFHDAEDLARILGIGLRPLRTAISTLRMLGLVDGQLRDGVIQVLPYGDGTKEIDEPSAEQVIEQVTEPEKLISADVEAQPKRESTGLSQKDRWEKIKAAWNSHKPERYLRLDGGINLPLFIAIETQSKRLGIDRDDYDAFIGAVCRGAAKDEWWSQRELKPTNVFGFGANLDDKKFENVEKLYQIGRRVEYSETRAAQATEEAQARWEEYNREQDAIDEAQELAAEEARREYQEIYTAWDARKKEGWSEIANDAVVAIAVQTLRSKLNNTESYDEFLRKAFSGYIGLKLTPREFADARMAIHPVDWRKCPLADAYIWYTKENA